MHQLSRALGAVASLTEETSDVVISALQATGKASASVRTWAIDAIGTSAALTQAFWSGIELRNASLRSSSGFATADSAEVLRTWLSQPEALRLMGNMTEVHEHSVNLIASVLAQLPAAGVKRRAVRITADYAFFNVLASLGAGGQVTLFWDASEANFSVAWSNAMWDAFDFAPPSDVAVVGPTVDAYFRKLPAGPPAVPTRFVVDASIGQAVRWKLKAYANWIFSWLPGSFQSAPYGRENLAGAEGESPFGAAGSP